MNIGVIIQARTGSTRLPGKMILPFYHQQGVLALLLQRIRQTLPESIKLIVATTTSPGDDSIARITEEAGCISFRGSEADVLSRFTQAATLYELDKVIRICADNPFLDMQALLDLVGYLRESDADYIAFATSEGLPTMKTHYGFWAEGVKSDALKKAEELTSEPFFHEHVTNFIYGNPDRFSLALHTIPTEIESGEPIRLTLDTAEDFAMQQQLYRMLMEKSPRFTTDEVLQTLKEHPDFYERMNKQIRLNSK